MDYSSLLPPMWKDTIKSWLRDDIPSFDYGAFVVGDKMTSAKLLGKSAGVLSGVPFFQDCSIEWNFKEGDRINIDDGNVTIAIVRGTAKNILMGERTALNIITRSSGISTASQLFTNLKEEKGWHGEIAATRKITPGFGLVEKYAVLVGGCSTHRMNLSSMVMLKDNHIWSTGCITSSVKKARKVCGFSTKIEVEARSLDEAIEAAKAGADIIMLDNFNDGDGLQKSAAELKSQFPQVIVEGSGGITLSTVGSYMGPSVDVLSVGALTQGYKTLDFSLKVIKNEIKI